MNKFSQLLSFFLSFLVFIVSPTLTLAQINLNSSGQVGIGTSPSWDNKLRVVYNSSAYTHTAVYAKSTGGPGNLYNYGIWGEASSPGMDNYGVYGKASGGSNNWAGYFNGNVYTTGSYQPSDEQFKKNITAVNADDMLSKIGQLKPVRYQFLSEAELRARKLPSLYAKEGNHIGLIAQDVEEIFPEFVIDVAQPLENEEGEVGEKPETVITKAINYQELTVALLAAVQKQQADIQALKTEIETLKAELAEVKQK